MSLFQVQLQNLVQGRLDMDPSSHPLASGTTAQPALYGALGSPFATSKQRQIYVAGPRRTYRLLKDGDTFTDCNYWKQFDVAYGCDASKAFIHTITDDGSVWSDVQDENTFGVGATVALTTNLADTVIDFVTTYGQPARFLQVQNLDASIKITGELNGDTNLTFTLAGGATQVFNVGDLAITKLRLKAASGTPSANYLAAVKSVAKS
jgi:hypothetical protein